MAKQTRTVLIDDIDGTEVDDVQPVRFALDGTSYELDLSASNRDQLAAALAPYVAPGRRVPRTRRKRTG